MADRKVSVEVEVKQTTKAPGPGGAPGTGGGGPGQSPQNFTDMARRLLDSISKGIGGPAIGGASAAAFSALSQALKIGVVSGFQASKGIITGAMVAAFTKKVQTPEEKEAAEKKWKAQQAAVGPQLKGGLQDIALAIGIATAAASGFMATMSPMTFHTLTGSIQLLGNEFVKLLIPAFSMASLTIQNVTQWMKGLDESTKSMIASTATWVAPGVVMLGIFGALAPILKLVTSGVFLLGSALITTGRAAMALLLTPWGVVLTTAALVVATLTGHFNLLGESIGRAGQRADEARERMARLQAPGARLSRADFQSLPAAMQREIELQPPERRGAYIEGLIRQERMNVQAIQFQGDPARRFAFVSQALERINDRGGGGFDQRITAMIDALTAAGQSRTSATAYVRGTFNQANVFDRTLRGPGAMSAEDIRSVATLASRSGQQMTHLTNEEILRAVRAQGVPGLFEGLRQSTPMQAQMFQSGADAYYQVLQEVASRGQLEQDILREIMRNTATQVAIMQQQNGGVANPPPLPPPVGPP